MRPEAGSVGALAWQLCAWIDRLFPDADRGERLKRALEERFGDDARVVSAEVCREIEALAHDSRGTSRWSTSPTDHSSATLSRRAGRRRIRARSS